MTELASTDLAFNNIIDGKLVAASDGATIDVLSPSNGQVFASISRSSQLDVDKAVKSARRAFESGTWGKLTALERGRLLMKLGEKILENHEELAQLEALDTGKPMTQARADITAAARYFEFYGSAADKVHGETIPYVDGYTVAVVPEPYGVTGHVIPWNYPAQMFGRTLAPALAMGNATVLKPAEEACLTPVKLSELALEAGFPPGAINVVTGYGHEAGAALSEHPDIDFISFTGSPDVGTIIQCAAAKNHIGCVLELGGKSPQIVFADADLEQALPVITNAIIQNAGQTCSAGSRLLVQQDIFEQVKTKLVARFSELRMGSHEMDLHCGPLISAKQQQRVKSFVDQAVASGLPLLAQAQLSPDAPVDGFYQPAALFGPVPRDHILAREEVFGPVLVMIPFADEADAIELANDTDFGLAAGVWTKDGARQIRVANAVRGGQVFINNYGAGAGIELPFGGVKKSGHGREKGFAALHEFSTTKTIVINHG
ncbi:aldehyde dehydrogenase family protein [Aestuariicella sp. G3-2]|uniref:aldehyde dehydrogenase family protein n=1 Tax=Pseudomaricurvus albidus TaxID=2842452 RepID=UPI001C0C19D1|nr:aldehyde dehydrogenase family protein [Aestuariicella albida]MBU3071388.1 aldehyde dehydrogenase family protein [Aestuariicella albida]